MLPHPGVFALNHLLAAEAWARDRLRPHAGQCIEFRAPPLPALRLDILASGFLADAARDAAPSLVVAIGAGALPALVRGQDALMRGISIEGNADLASTVQYLFRHLRWDVEEDLSQAFGDALAHRILNGSRGVLSWGSDTAEKLAQNLTEYWIEEQPLLARPGDVRRFGAEVGLLRDDLARIEKRIEALTKTA